MDTPDSLDNVKHKVGSSLIPDSGSSRRDGDTRLVDGWSRLPRLDVPPALATVNFVNIGSLADQSMRRPPVELSMHRPPVELSMHKLTRPVCNSGSKKRRKSARAYQSYSSD